MVDKLRNVENMKNIVPINIHQPSLHLLFKVIFIFLTVVFYFLVKGSPAIFSQTNGPVIATITDNRAEYTGSTIPKFEKFEITFQIQNTSATNTFYPYDPNPPAGVPANTGISVSALFTDPQGTSYAQPAFYYQAFDDQIKGSNDEWIYPQNQYSWKVRFSPNKTGTWSYRLTATDSTGTSTTTNQTFTVSDSTSHGFIKASPNDPRYFEYEDGTYFPALGYNMNGGGLNYTDPVIGNTPRFQAMAANGIQLTRIWPTQSSIYGEAWGGWTSSNRYHNSVQEQRYGIINQYNSALTANYTDLTAPTPPAGSEYYMWLEYNTTVASNGEQQRFTPCRYLTNIPVKQNTQYRVKVRYQTRNLEGPKVSGQPFGFAVKTTTSGWGSTPDRCNDHDAGTIVAQTATTADTTNWEILEGTFTTGAIDFLPYIYVSFNNVRSQDSDNDAGHIFIDEVWLEEASCSSNCPNLFHKPNMDMHQYINQRSAYAFDKIVGLAEQYGLYLKAVMNEKNDRIFQNIDFNGNLTSSPSTNNFYGNLRTVTKVRWLQQAWWRYMQARWGYSPNIHSWELLNEGSDGSTSGHWEMADEFGKYMKCRVFGITVSSANPYQKCNYNHPNHHMVSTSFFNSSFPWRFWNNQASGVELTFAEMDYIDQHYYANVEDTSAIASYYDSALFSYKLSTLESNFAPGKRKPFMRGETAWNVPASTYLGSNAEGGEWLHDFIWAGINPGGLMEHFFAGGVFSNQIYNLSATPPYDNRPMFGTFHRFIKDIPLNNGQYQDASASASVTQIRAWGQKDVVNKRAHLWIANKNHTWYNVLGGYTGGPTPVAITPVSGTVTLSGFTPNTSYPVQWWNTYTGQPETTQPSTLVTANSIGEITLSVSNVTSDTAVRIGNYNSVSTKPGDANSDGSVNGVDYGIWFGHYGQTVTNTFRDGDFNADGRVDGLDYVIWLRNYGN